MHHLRQIKGINVKLDFFGKQMAAINRKQAPPGADHHSRLHSGKLTEEESRNFSENCKKYNRRRDTTSDEGKRKREDERTKQDKPRNQSIFALP